MTNHESKTGAAASKAKESGAEVADTLRNTVHDAAGKVSSEVSGAAEKARSGAAQEVKQIADALHTAAGELHEGSSQQRMFHRLADNVDHMSKAMNDKNLGDMLNDLNDLARRNPMLFLGGAALAGFAATRLATASSPDKRTTGMSQGSMSQPGSTPARPAGSSPQTGTTATPVTGAAPTNRGV
ncbi:MAG: hypothetical protein LPK02_14270 [Rhodobacterales bacterium]|nr:hypothetical protein [Rhodobacterales bacterium]